jgi:hypothetical protein
MKNEVSSLHACWFSFWFKVGKPYLIVHHSPPQKSITLNVLSLQMFQQYRDAVLFVYVSVDMVLTGNTPYDIPNPLELHAEC